VKNKFPHSITIISIILFVFTLLTWFIPAGEFDRESIKINGIEKQVIIQDSYKQIESVPQSYQIFLAPIKGFTSAADIIAFILLVGGAFSIINKTGAINSGLMQIIKLVEKKNSLRSFVIPLIMFLFSVAGATFGMAEEVLVFIMITIPLSYALGYDSLVGIAIPFVGAGVGFASAFLNPFTVGIAQGIAGISPLFSGLEVRLAVWIVFTIISIFYVSKYAKKVYNNPEKGLFSISIDEVDSNVKEIIFNSKHKFVLFLLFVSMIALIVGVNVFGWYINEISALFVLLGILSAFTFKFSSNQTITSFLEGAKDMITPVIIIALAKGVLIIAEDGKIIDTILYYFANMSEGLPKLITVEIIFFLQSILNFFVPSGSGQAALTMPILSPLSEVLGVHKQTTVLAYQFGDGLSNFIIPTSGVTMGILEIAKVPYNKWLKWILPLFFILVFTAMTILAVLSYINLWDF
jgi:uncharacterized ion transporter superfamily protein YfcC